MYLLAHSQSDGHGDNDRTRDRVRQAVVEHGPITAAQLARSLHLTTAAVRRHLDSLETAGIVEVNRTQSPGPGAGRPARFYVLSRGGQQALGDEYLDIARTALARLAEHEGKESVHKFAQERSAAMEARYASMVHRAGPDIAMRARALCEALNRDGFVASARQLSTILSQRTGPTAAVQLCQGHCPVMELAADFPEFCEAETAMFSRLLGVDVRRLSTLATGSHVCTTHIPLGRSTLTRKPSARITLDRRKSTYGSLRREAQQLWHGHC